MQLNCPLPKLDFDVITLGHGSGGVLTHRLLDTGVFNILKNDLLNEQHDGAILNFNGPVAFTTDSYVVTPIFFPGGNIGELAVNGSINDLAMCGAVPEYLSLSFILEEGLRMDEFWEVLVGIKKASDASGVPIVTGDTKVVERGKGDKVFINTTGLGRIHPKANIHANRVKPGDKILVSGPVAQHGVAILSVRQGLEFETTITSDTQPLHTQVIRLLDELGEDVRFLRDPTRGGVATVLNELATQSGHGVEIIQKDIPVSEQVEGACELLGLDPLYVANEGIFIAVVAEHKANDALSILKSFDASSSIIGNVTQEHPRQVIQHSRIGGRRIVSMLPGEQLPRIC
ncbi:MAG: hydrogenase expression/formation protein HypE [Cyclobacteriaceae bacterium]|nr:hydrogenase expression/formation protein HypE [Cyclobacteriaceae bacterium]